MTQGCLTVLRKEFISDFLEPLLPKKRKVYHEVTCEIMFLGLEFVWQRFSRSTHVEFSLCILDMEADVFLHDEDDMGLLDS